MKISFFNKKRLKILTHILVWIFLFLIPWFFFNQKWDQNMNEIGKYYYRIFINGVFFYILYLWVVPIFFFKQRKYNFIIITILLMTGLYFIQDLGNSTFFPDTQKDAVFRQEISILLKKSKIPSPPFKRMHIYDFILTSIFITGVSLGMRIKIVR